MNLFEMAQIPLNKAIEVMKLDPNAAAIIACPERTLEVSIPVKMVISRFSFISIDRSIFINRIFQLFSDPPQSSFVIDTFYILISIN